MARIRGFHPRGPGSIPGMGVSFCFFYHLQLLKEKEFSRHFSKSYLSPLFSSSLSAVARKHEKVKPTVSGVLASVRDAASKTGNSMLLRAAQKGIRELGLTKEPEAQDICTTFKQRLESERKLKLGSLTLAQGGCVICMHV